MPFNELFGGQVLLPAQLTYNNLVITVDTDLVWPLEQQVGGTNVVADIIDLDTDTPGLNVNMPDARLVSQGTSVLYNNVGSQTVTVRDAAGGVIISLVSGSTWMIYLVDNTVEAGVWRTFQFGASISTSNAAALAGAGLKAITTTLNARIVTAEKAATPYNVLNADRAIALVWTSGVGTFNLAAAGTVGADWFCYVRNSGSGDLTVTPPAGTIDGAASKTFAPGDSGAVVCDGVNYYTLGFGSGGSGGGGGFDFLAIAVPGSGDYTLSGAELGRIGYRFTGVLTGTRNIIVPGTTDEYWVDNQTSGAFSLFVKTAAQVPGVEIQQTSRNILYCDGTNVLAAESSTISFPVAVAQGGTGAVTAAAARTNLGATVTGSALFTAVDAAAARTAIAAVPTSRLVSAGFGLTGGGDLTADRTLAVVLSSLTGRVQKAAQTARSSTIVLAPDPDLFFNNLPAGTYVVEARIKTEFNGGTQGIRFAFSGTNLGAGTGDSLYYIGSTGGGGTDTDLMASGSATVTGGSTYNSETASSFQILQISALCTLSGTGNIEFSWAQDTSSATATDVGGGSWMFYLRVA